MRVDELRVDPWGEGRELSGRISFERAGLEPQRLWFRSPVAPAGQLDASPFLPALLVLSMWLGEPLAIDGPVSPRLLEHVERASLVLRSWWPELEPARVEPARAEVPATHGGDVGVFFTRGVDSWHTALETARENPASLRLLGWTGADLESPEHDTPQRELAAGEALTEAAGLVPAEVDLMQSNLRRLVEPHVAWEWTHGGLLAALALAHGGLAEARIAGTLPFGRLTSLGSHPLLDPLWSTETMRVVHHAPEVTRVEKIAVLAERPDVLGTLKVCDELDDPRRNCGRCGKCTRTMVGLEIAGVLGEAPFEGPLTQRGVARIPVAASIEREFGYELLRALSAARRRDLSDPLQMAFAADLARRAWRRAWVVARGRLWRGIHRLRRLAALPADWWHRLRSRAG